ncbi:MAG: 16S rRNA pseudouridine(516) synthase [Solobacterium sp.]|nr:16S rRNA pseudouridine(516) synthase [Solobacterium sp.]
MRLDKMLADLGYGTRNEIRKACRQGRIVLNGEYVKDCSIHVNPEEDEVLVDEEPVLYSRYVYFMLNKPIGVVSATSDRQMTVLDLIDSGIKGLFPVGRLDKDTEGLLLITNDGQLGHRLLSPRHHVEKEYEVELALPLKEEDVTRFASGIQLSDGERCLPSTLIITSETAARVILTEGKYHQIKRMFEAVGNQVVGLKRVRMKHLVLDESLAPGEYRELTKEELADLKELAGSDE